MVGTYSKYPAGGGAREVLEFAVHELYNAYRIIENQSKAGQIIKFSFKDITNTQ
jgi:hypothetical protein